MPPMLPKKKRGARAKRKAETLKLLAIQTDN